MLAKFTQTGGNGQRDEKQGVCRRSGIRAGVVALGPNPIRKCVGCACAARVQVSDIGDANTVRLVRKNPFEPFIVVGKARTITQGWLMV
jgi:hypothetical protein